MRDTVRAGLGAALLALLAGCGGGEGTGHAGHVPPTTTVVTSAPPTTSAPSAASTQPVVGDYNLADVMYLQMAIANHTQGVELAKLALDRPVRPEVRELAGAIEATQRTELDAMRAWLTGWEQPEQVDPDPDAHAHHGGMPLTDPASITALASAPDAEFERRFLTLLTGHQHNAVDMARRELADGVSPPVKQFADKVVRSRTAQISRLLTLSDA